MVQKTKIKVQLCGILSDVDVEKTRHFVRWWPIQLTARVFTESMVIVTTAIHFCKFDDYAMVFSSDTACLLNFILLLSILLK